MNRRGFLGGLIGLAAPTIIRTPGLLMPIRSLQLGDSFLVRDYLTDSVFLDTGASSHLGLHPQLLWPGIRQWWVRAYAEVGDAA